ncbi:Serine-protein kinase ATM [Lamellibrachia satsuma]|nr:Serine-protein kinase ATM [Lamellibrachia satsuma]
MRRSLQKLLLDIFMRFVKPVTLKGKLSMEDVQYKLPYHVKSHAVLIIGEDAWAFIAEKEKRALRDSRLEEFFVNVKRYFVVVCDYLVAKLPLQQELLKHAEVADARLQVLHQVCECNDYSSVESFTSSHLPYLSQQWLLNCYSITEFPYQLFDYRRLADFYKAHYSTIVPLLVMQKDIAAVKTVAETIGSEWCHLLEACVPKVLVHILPLFAMSKCGKVTSLRNMQTKVAHATACYDSLVAVVKQESIDKCVVTHLDNIVVDILMTLHENQASVDRFTRDYDPEPNPPQFDTDTIITTLDYLTKGHGGSVKSLVELLSKSQDSIQNILLALKCHLASAHRLHEKCRVLRMYRLFVSLLLREFHLRLGGSWAFVLRDVIYTLLHNLHSAQQHHRSRCVAYNTDLLCMSCDLLHSVCEVAVQHCPAELGRFLSAITSTLIPYMTEDSQGEVGRLTGIRWNFCSSLEDLIYADDLALPSHTRDQVQTTSNLEQQASSIGLSVNTRKTKVFTNSNLTKQPIVISNHRLEYVNKFTYLGSIVSLHGGAEEDIKTRLGKARSAFANLQRLWKSSVYSQKTKLRMYQSNVLSVLLYGSECWRMTLDANRLSSLNNTCVRKILKVYWPETISNTRLHQVTKQQHICLILKTRRWTWLGHVYRMNNGLPAKTGLTWTP